jgi:hypothetical protein
MKTWRVKDSCKALASDEAGSGALADGSPAPGSEAQQNPRKCPDFALLAEKRRLKRERARAYGLP